MQYQSIYDLIQWAFIREYRPTPEQAGGDGNRGARFAAKIRGGNSK